jgi:hypothetical protein
MRTRHSPTAAWILLLFGFPALGLAQDSAPPPGNPVVSPAASTSQPRTDNTLRLLVVKKNGQAVTDLRAGDLRLRVNNQTLKILSVSSTARLPKTIGIFIDGTFYRGFDPLVAKEIDAIKGVLESVWQEQDTGFVVSFSDKIHNDVPPTSQLRQIENAFPKILTRDFDRPQMFVSDTYAHVLPSWRLEVYSDFEYLRNFREVLWYQALSSRLLPTKETGGGEKIYVILSDFLRTTGHRPALEAVLNQRARIFPFLGIPGSDVYIGEGGYNNGANEAYEAGLWKAQDEAENIAKKNGRRRLHPVEAKGSIASAKETDERASERLPGDL